MAQTQRYRLLLGQSSWGMTCGPAQRQTGAFAHPGRWHSTAVSMRRHVRQEKKRESEDEINDEKLHAFQPVGASVARYLARDQNGQKDDQHEAGGKSQIHRRGTDKVAREYQERGHEQR